MTKLPSCQKKAPKALKSLDAGLKSAPVPAGKRGASSLRGASTANSGPADPRRRLSHTRKANGPHDGEGIFPACKALKNHETAKNLDFARACFSGRRSATRRRGEGRPNDTPRPELSLPPEQARAPTPPPPPPWTARRACGRWGRARSCAGGSTSASPRPTRRPG